MQGDGADWIRQAAAENTDIITKHQISLALDEDSKLSVTYAQKGAFYVRQEGASWRSEKIDEANANDISLALGRDGSPHAAYDDYKLKRLLYAVRK